MATVSDDILFKSDSEKRSRIDFPTLLRSAGTIAVLVAMYSFLVKGWDSSNDVMRYLMMLGHTGLIAILGLASSRVLKESKGARVLLSLALVSIPANFAVLGSLVYSQVHLAELASLPDYMVWTVDSLTTALLTAGGALLVLIPVCYFGFAVLARGVSARFATFYLASNLLLLIPTREQLEIGIIAVVLSTIILLMVQGLAKIQSTLQTREGVIAIALQFIPLAILLGRNLAFYQTDEIMLALISFIAFLVLRQVSLAIHFQSVVRVVLEFASLLPVFTLGVSMASILGVEFSQLNLPAIVLVSVSITGALIYELSSRALRAGWFFRILAVSIVMLAFVSILFMAEHFVYELATIVMGAVLALRGYQAHQKSLFFGGIVLLGIGLVGELFKLGQVLDYSNWMYLAGFGITAILVGSLIESKGQEIKARMVATRDGLSNWVV